jgi:hypothetical protein
LGRGLKFPEIGIGTRVELRQKPLRIRLPDLTATPRRERRYLSLLTTLLLDPTHPRFRNIESQRDGASSLARIAGS